MGRNTGTNGRLRGVLAVGVLGVFALVLTACPPPPAPTTTTEPESTTTLLESANAACDAYTPVGIGVSSSFITPGDNFNVIGFVNELDGQPGNTVQITLRLASDQNTRVPAAPASPILATATVNSSGFWSTPVQIPSTADFQAIVPAISQWWNGRYWKVSANVVRADSTVCTARGSASVVSGV